MTQLSNEQQAAIVAAAEKLVRCKGRYHSEQNYRALAALFGVTVPDLPPLAAEAREPVGEVVLGDYDDCGDYPEAKVVCIAAQGQADWNNFRNGTKLYAAPQPVAVPDEIQKLKDGRGFKYVKDGIHYSVNYANGWNQCRAAMLSAEAVSQPYTLPDGWKLVPVEPTDEMLNALYKLGTRLIRQCEVKLYKSMLAAAPEVPSQQNAQQNIPENIPTLRDAVTTLRNSGIAIDAEKIFEELDYSQECEGCNDDWIPCSERMPGTDGNYWGWWRESKRQGPVWFIKSALQAQFQSSEITHWMPLPAAPQEPTK